MSPFLLQKDQTLQTLSFNDLLLLVNVYYWLAALMPLWNVYSCPLVPMTPPHHPLFDRRAADRTYILLVYQSLHLKHFQTGAWPNQLDVFGATWERPLLQPCWLTLVINLTHEQILTQAGMRHTAKSLKKALCAALALPTGALRTFTWGLPKLDAPGQRVFLPLLDTHTMVPTKQRGSRLKSPTILPESQQEWGQLAPRSQAARLSHSVNLEESSAEPKWSVPFLHTKAPIDWTLLAHHGHPWEKNLREGSELATSVSKETERYSRGLDSQIRHHHY